MTGPAKPRESRDPTPPADEVDDDGTPVPADPDAPGRSLFDEDDDAVEPNEPA